MLVRVPPPGARARIPSMADPAVDTDVIFANAIEIAGFARCFTTADQKEGMSAFLAKRAPQFTGR